MNSWKNWQPHPRRLTRLSAATRQSLACCCVVIGGTSAWAQQIAPPCGECEPFEARYSIRPTVLIAKVRDSSDSTSRLWYLNESLDAGLGVLSWNALGEIVGTRFEYDRCIVPTTLSTPRAFLWLPQARYGLPAVVPHDLYSFEHPLDRETPSFAWDISDEGLVVGSAGALAETPGGTARAWNMPSLPPLEFETNFGGGGAKASSIRAGRLRSR